VLFQELTVLTVESELVLPGQEQASVFACSRNQEAHRKNRGVIGLWNDGDFEPAAKL